MVSGKEKEFFTAFRAGLVLSGIMLLAAVAHFCFFIQDMRPFVDHDFNYAPGYHLSFLYDFIVILTGRFFPDFAYSGIYLYKSLNVICLILLVLFVYLTASHVYSRAAGLLASFWVIGSPYVINVYHKQEVSSLTATFLAVIIYLALKCDYLRKFYYSLFLIITLGLFILHHYGALLYLAVMAAVLLVVQGKMLIRNYLFRRSFLLLFFFLLLFYKLCSAYKYYATREYFYAWEYQLAIFFDSTPKATDSNPFFRLMDHILYAYNVFFLYFNFYVWNSIIVVVFWVGLFCYRKFKKIASGTFELKMVLIVLGYFIFLLTGKGILVRYSASLFFILAVLNGGMIVYLFETFGKTVKAKIIFFIYASFLTWYVIAALFAPAMLSFGVKDETYVFRPLEDNYNLPALIDFCDDNDVMISDIEIVGYDDKSWSYGELLFFSISLESGMLMQDFMEFMYTKKADDRMKYLWIVYPCVEDTAWDKDERIGVIEEKVSRKALSVASDAGFSDVSLQRIIPYGHSDSMKDMQHDFITDAGLKTIYRKYPECEAVSAKNLFLRSSLIFIYELGKRTISLNGAGD